MVMGSRAVLACSSCTGTYRLHRNRTCIPSVASQEEAQVSKCTCEVLQLQPCTQRWCCGSSVRQHPWCCEVNAVWCNSASHLVGSRNHLSNKVLGRGSGRWVMLQHSLQHMLQSSRSFRQADLPCTMMRSAQCLSCRGADEVNMCTQDWKTTQAFCQRQLSRLQAEHRCHSMDAHHSAAAVRARLLLK